MFTLSKGTARLTLFIDRSLHDYLLSQLSEEDIQNQTLPAFAARAISSELQGCTLDLLRARIEICYALSFTARENTGKLLKFLIVNMLDEKRDDIQVLIDEVMVVKKQVPDWEFGLVRSLSGQSVMMPRLNGAMLVKDSKTTKIVVEIARDTYRDLVKSTHELGVSEEELAVHLLYNYRDNAVLRDLLVKAAMTQDAFENVLGATVNVIEKVLITLKPEMEAEIKKWLEDVFGQPI